MKTKSKSHSLVIYLFSFAIAAIPFLSVQSEAQTITATITGIVRDQADAIIANAKVSVTAESTGNSKTAVTDEQGRYTLSFLQPGVYKIMVEVAGFKTLTRAGITLEVAQVLTLD